MECFQQDDGDDEEEELERKTFIKDVHEAFQVLFALTIPLSNTLNSRYISGVNEEYEEIEMTVPVLTNMKLLENNMINKQMCFYLEEKHQENPPTPVDEDITIEKKEEMTLLVHRFGG